jgi:RNA polymerase sigma-70 factor (sigma-E family)
MDLLRRSRAHDEFERFAAAHADGLVRAAYLMVGDRGDAEDIVQECMLRLARKWPRVRAMEHPGAYARRVMVSLVLDGGRQRSRRSLELATTQSESRSGAWDEAFTSLDARADLIHALGGLPARPRAVLVLRYFSDLPEAEVATILGCSVGTVKSSASRALERLRQTLDESETQPNGGPKQQAARRTVR